MLSHGKFETKMKRIMKLKFWVMFLPILIYGCNDHSKISDENTSTSNSQSISYDGIYSLEDNSVNFKIIINGNTWSGESMLNTGFGYENDSQTAEYYEGTLIEDQLYIGDVNVGSVTKNFLDIELGSQSFSLYKN
jgi:hypothetical protein